MSPAPPKELPAPGVVTRLLHAWSQGDPEARDQLMPVVYAELRRRAAGFVRRERPGNTLRPTDLVHEAYIRLSARNPGFANREQFFGIACRVMRRVLVDHARARGARKRGGGGLRVTLAADLAAASAPAPELLELDAALDELSALDERQARFVELRFFGGLSLDESARSLGVSIATASRDWAMAKAWLYRRLKASGSLQAPGGRGNR